MDREQVLLGWRQYKPFHRTLTLLGAPIEIDEEPLFTGDASSFRFGLEVWTPIESVWRELADQISRDLTAHAQAEAEHNQRMVAAARAGEEYALWYVSMFRADKETTWEPVTWKPGNLYGFHACRNCGNAMLRYDANVEYCSIKCRREHGLERKRNWARDNADKRPIRAKLPEYAPTCASCGTTFKASRSDARYCSATCRQRARRNVKNTLALGVDVD